MPALRKAVTGTVLIFWSAAALAAEFAKGPADIPALPALPVQMDLPFPAGVHAIEAMDPLANAARIAPQAAAPSAPAQAPTLGAIQKAFAPQIRAAGDRRASDGELSSAGRAAYDGGGELPMDSGGEPARLAGTGGVVKTPLPNPGRFYDRAFADAVYYAGRKGLPRESVSLERITGNIPASENAAHLMYAFDAQSNKRAFKIYVDFSPHWALAGQDYGSRVSVYDLGSPAQDRVASHEASLPRAVVPALRAAPETALRLAREKAPRLSSQVSFKLGLTQGRPVYVFYDARGGRVAVDARMGRVSVLEEPSGSAGAGAQYRALREALTGLVRRVAQARPKVARAQIEAAARSAASQKGRPWSQTEYDANRAQIAYHLQLHGATQEQLRLFYELTDKAPILNGGFNPWSGD